MEKTAVTVKIFNDEYTLKTDLPQIGRAHV